MITAPSPIPPQPGPLRAPSEEQVAAAYPELRDRALTLTWTAEALGTQALELLPAARAGKLLLVPGPWPMRQADYHGYFVPAWQLLPAGRGPDPAIPTLVAAAAEAGWTSLELHCFMTSPQGADGATPAALLHAGDAARGAARSRGEPARRQAPRPAPARDRRGRRVVLQVPHRARSCRNRHVPTLGGLR